MTRLRILAGTSLDDLTPIEANSGIPIYVKSDVFEGQIVVHIKGFADENGNVSHSSYFDQKERKGITWSIQAQGRFLQPHSADDIMFGNVFDRPLKLPWGFSAALKFMKLIDPTLEQDLTSKSQPWALSPLIATMPHFVHTRIDQNHKAPQFPPRRPITVDVVHLPTSSQDPSSKRRTYFQSAIKRKELTFGPQDLITTDFCYDYLEFSPDGISLKLPVGISIDMLRYWDGQPVRFVCCERIPKGTTRDGVPWGRMFCYASPTWTYTTPDLGSTDKCRYYPNEHTTNNKHSNQNGLCSRHINRCYFDMAHITIHNLPREYRPGKPFEQVKKSRPLIRLPPVLDGTKYTEGPFPPVFWYGVLVDPPALIDIAVDDYKYARPKKVDPAWPMFSPIWTQSLLKYIGKQAGVAVPIEWRYRRVYCREKIVWCLSISHNYGPYPEQFGVEMKKIWDYFKEKRGLLTMDCPRWYLTMDTDYCEIFWRDRL